MAVNPIDLLRPSTVSLARAGNSRTWICPEGDFGLLATVALVVLALYPGMLAVVRILSVLRGGPIILWLDSLIVSSLALSTLAVSCLPWTGSSRYYSLTNDPGGVVAAAHRSLTGAGWARDPRRLDDRPGGARNGGSAALEFFAIPASRRRGTFLGHVTFANREATSRPRTASHLRDLEPRCAASKSQGESWTT